MAAGGADRCRRRKWGVSDAGGDGARVQQWHLRGGAGKFEALKDFFKSFISWLRLLFPTVHEVTETQQSAREVVLVFVCFLSGLLKMN